MRVDGSWISKKTIKYYNLVFLVGRMSLVFLVGQMGTSAGVGLLCTCLCAQINQCFPLNLKWC